MTSVTNVIGPGGQLYADPQPTPGEVTFRQDNTSAAYYTSPYYLAHRNQVRAIPPRRNTAAVQLSNFLPADVIAAITGAGSISFHAAGDTGAAKVNRSQTVATAIGNEAHVADGMATEVRTQGTSGPAFLFILGDVIYNFGEAQYYYDQLYEPYRGYDRPIFAIPGNHDAMVFGPTSTAPQNVSLGAFQANFCAAAPGPSPDAPGIMRSVMTQPGVYFTLDAPFVSVIGLYSNVLEGPGVISSQSGRYPVSDEQLAFLQSELSRLKPDRVANRRAIVLAVHHPPLSVDAVHGGSTGLQADLDSCCAAAGLFPDVVLSGHAHLYQRYKHVTTTGQEIPYIVSGSGGFSATAPMTKPPPVGTTIGPDTLIVGPIVQFGYLTVSTDATHLSVTFNTSVGGVTAQADSVTVDLLQGKIVTAAATARLRKAAAARAKARAAKRPNPKSSVTLPRGRDRPRQKLKKPRR